MTKYGAQVDEEQLVPQRIVAPEFRGPAKSKTKWALRVAAVIGLSFVAGCGYAAMNHSLSDAVEVPKMMEDLPEFSELSAALPEETEMSVNPLDGCEVAALQADTGKYLSRCRGCAQSRFPDSATVHPVNTNGAYVQWKIERLSSNVVALRSDNGKLLSNCKDCISRAAYPYSAFLLDTSSQQSSESRWVVNVLPGEKVSLQSMSTKKYLARCNGCASGQPADRAFVHASTNTSPWAQWKVVCLKRSNPVSACPSHQISLKSDIGMYLSRCNGCARSPYADSATVHVSHPSASYAKWTVVPINDDTVALRADTGKYLARCNGCMRATTADTAFIHVTHWSGKPWAQWKVVRQPNGKVALQSDTGKYLARCNGCASGAPANRAFVHETSATAPWAQWTVVCH